MNPIFLSGMITLEIPCSFCLITSPTTAVTWYLLNIGQGTSIKRQRSDLFGLRINLPPVTTGLTTQR